MGGVAPDLAGRGAAPQEIGNKEAEVRAGEGTLAANEAEQRGLEARRNALNDERKELWRFEAAREEGLSAQKAEKARAEKRVRNPVLKYNKPSTPNTQTQKP